MGFSKKQRRSGTRPRPARVCRAVCRGSSVCFFFFLSFLFISLLVPKIRDDGFARGGGFRGINVIWYRIGSSGKIKEVKFYEGN